MSNKEELFDNIRLGNSEAVENLLESNPKLLESKDQRGSTPLLLAAYYGHENVVEFLLEKGATVDALDGSGNTALMGVCFKGYTDIAKKLIDAGANVSQKNAMGATCLIYAVTFNRKDIAEMLLEHGADASIKDNRGKTAMDLVLEQGNTELEELLKKYQMSTTLNLALIQTDLYWEDPVSNRKMFEEKIEGISDDVDLIILPEMFTTAFTMKPEKILLSESKGTLDWMKKIAQESNTALIGSIVFQESGKFFNRLFFASPNGTVATYDKKHTFTLAGEDEVYEAGNEKLIFEYKGFKICPMICYDLRFPVWSRNVEDYDVLIYVANWPSKRINAWDTLLKARAIENMAYCVGVNRTGTDGLDYEYPGHSAVYDVLGEPLAFSQDEEVLYATLNKEHVTSTRKQLRFLEDRDNFSLIG